MLHSHTVQGVAALVAIFLFVCWLLLRIGMR
jgi:hypothetical protein